MLFLAGDGSIDIGIEAGIHTENGVPYLPSQERSCHSALCPL
jgi:hypothetical protein